jgi:hypothetical protein
MDVNEKVVTPPEWTLITVSRRLLLTNVAWMGIFVPPGPTLKDPPGNTRQRQKAQAERIQTAEDQMMERDHEEILAYMRQNLPVVKSLKNGVWYDPVRGVLAADPSKEGRLYRLQGRIATVGRDYKMTSSTLTYYFLVNNAGVLAWEKGSGDYAALAKLKVLGGSPPGLTTIPDVSHKHRVSRDLSKASLFLSQ